MLFRSLKQQVKYLKAGYKAELDKNVELQKEIASLTTKLKETEERLKENEPSAPHEFDDSSIKDKETIIALQNEIKGLKEELNLSRTKCKDIEENTEKIKTEQANDIGEFTERIKDLTIKNAELHEEIRAKDNLVESYKTEIENLQNNSKSKGKSSGEVAKLKKQIEDLTNECKNYKIKIEEDIEDKKFMNDSIKQNKNAFALRIEDFENQLREKEELIMNKEGEITNLRSAVFENQDIDRKSVV